MSRPTDKCKMHRSTHAECPSSRTPGHTHGEVLCVVGAEYIPSLRHMMFRTNNLPATIKYNCFSSFSARGKFGICILCKIPALMMVDEVSRSSGGHCCTRDDF